MQEIYILIKSEGIYDSQTSFPVAAFMNREAAEKECKRLNDEMDDLQSLFPMQAGARSSQCWNTKLSGMERPYPR